MAGADLPGVIVNVQRGGPGLGSIQPSQADYWQATKATGHGDFHIVVYAPSTVQEMADYAFKAFDTADKYRVPVMIMADGMLGQMMEPVVLPEALAPEDLPEKPWATCGHGHKRPHNVANSLYLTASDLEDLVRERYERYAVIEETEQEAESYLTEDADIVLVAFGARGPLGGERRARAGHQGGACAPHHAVALPDPGHRGARAHGQGVPRRGDEHGPDGGRCAPGGGGARAGGVLRPHWRRHPDARRGAGGHCRFEREGR